MPWKPEEIVERLYGLIIYLFSSGLELKEGESVGLSNDEKFFVSFNEYSGLKVMHLKLQKN